MLSIVIPTLNSANELDRSFNSLMPALMDDMIKEVIIVDSGSSDETKTIAEAAGAKLINSEPNRGLQLSIGAQEASADWLLFLHADTELEANWHQEVRAFIQATESGEKTAAFRFALNDKSIWARLLTVFVALRCRFFKLPYGDQALLISRHHYRSIGGHSPLPLMEDVDIIRRLENPVTILKSRAITSAVRYKKDGYLKRCFKNLTCLNAYYRGVNINEIKQLYEQ